MKTPNTVTRLATISFTLLIFMIPLTVFADGVNENVLMGRNFKIFIYGEIADKASATISFKENFNLLIDAYDGFGIYVPTGNVFAAIFSAPDYSKNNYGETNDLFLILSGAVVSDFMGAVGLAYINYEFDGVWLIFGYAII